MANLIDYEKMAKRLTAMAEEIFANTEDLEIDAVLNTLKQIDDALIPIDIAHSLSLIEGHLDMGRKAIAGGTGE